MGEPEIVGEVLQKSLADNPELRKKLLQKEIFNRWQEIFPAFADKFFPVKIDGETLIVDSNDSAFKDMLKFGAPDFIQKINEKISPGLPIISKIKFGKSFEDIPSPLKKNSAPKIWEEIQLSAEEIDECKKKVAAVADETQRQFLLETILSYKKAEKRKLKSGWHKCKFCNLLCPPKEILCNICAVKEREKLFGAIKKIFLAAPETPFQEIQQKIIRQFPHLYKECTLEKIESARMDLILKRAAKISYGDTTSDAAIFLVQLIRQLPREKLTPAIINRTLEEFKFNLADLPPFKKHEFSKPRHGKLKKVSK